MHVRVDFYDAVAALHVTERHHIGVWNLNSLDVTAYLISLYLYIRYINDVFSVVWATTNCVSVTMISIPVFQDIPVSFSVGFQLRSYSIILHLKIFKCFHQAVLPQPWQTWIFFLILVGMSLFFTFLSSTFIWLLKLDVQNSNFLIMHILFFTI